ncbi:MAG: exodeoxyribonuclease VII large subunit [Gammaproteobacteria bacterium]|nr:exodeoxyribonuclease VII large subunit [Gammaproteobacteria bacterium]
MIQESIPIEPLARDVYTVSRLNHEARNLLETSFTEIWVEGELSNVARPASGHLYFSLKDNDAQIRCAMFRNRHNHLHCEPRDGRQVLLRGRVSLYEERGDYQLIVQFLEDAGEGALQRKFEALKRALLREGLFDTAHKLEFPTWPQRIGVITSPSGAAIRDIITTLKRRFPAIPVLVYPVPVQGTEAVPEIAAALRLANLRRDCDALILARGGGSLEDLWAFNDEMVARAIFDCTIPIVTGIGHEIDLTIADLVADWRAATPTAAAELLSPDMQEVLNRLADTRTTLLRTMDDRLDVYAQRLDNVVARMTHPRERLSKMQQRLTSIERHMDLVMKNRIWEIAHAVVAFKGRLLRNSPNERLGRSQITVQALNKRLHMGIKANKSLFRNELRNLTSRLHNVSPLATLERGYAVVYSLPQRRLIRRASSVSPGDKVEARLSAGRIECRVEKVQDD